MPKYLVYSLLWCMTGDGKLKDREDMGTYIQKITTIPLPPLSSMPIIDFEVSIAIAFARYVISLRLLILAT